MAKPEALARVDADLDRGHTHLATQRLNSLIAQDPYDLGLRARLAAVHRRTGNHAGAGRWGYLTGRRVAPHDGPLRRRPHRGHRRLRAAAGTPPEAAATGLAVAAR